ncbi:P-loop ATPase, Sll1717 family [Streptomyces sp. NPDC058045]|uniref:P-loop ATPase, Sll1717 family n=1 Tax=Streptomyces sp. NPDC058045 TaxID=3346311 RepID=UPI0036F12EFF
MAQSQRAGGAVEQPYQPVKKLFFGRDDAESDFADGLLRDGFQSTYASEAVLAGRKSLVVGRKGSGKSAICAHLMSGRYPGRAALITPDDAAGDEIRRFELQGLTADTAKSLIWRYVFAVHAAKHVTEHADAHRRWRAPASVRALKDFLQANGEGGDGRLTDRLRRGTRLLQSATLVVKMFGLEASFSAGGEPGANGGSEGARAMRQLDALEAGLRAAFEDLGCVAAQEKPFLILVDQLEQVWQGDSDSHPLITGLLLGAKHVVAAYGHAVRCVLFVRADIYDALNFADGDKFRSDEVRITWSPAALRGLACARAVLSLERPVTDEELWDGIFPRRVAGEWTPDYLVRRSLARPRDIIQFLTLCRDAADRSRRPTIHEDDVLEAAEQFSRWKLDDLAKEYNVGFPFLRPVFAQFENAGYAVDRNVFTARFDEIRDDLHERYSAYTEQLTATSVIDALYGIGFLGVRRGDGVVYAGDSQWPLQPYENDLRVHPCFRPALGCRTPTSSGDTVIAAGHQYQAPVVRVQSHTGFLRNVSTTDAGFQADRHVRLLEQTALALSRLRRQLARSGLPAEAHTEVREGIDLLDERIDALPLPGAGLTSDMVEDLIDNVTARLAVLHTRMKDLGFRDDPVTRRLADEAAALRRAVGGAVGGGGGSDSSG